MLDAELSLSSQKLVKQMENYPALRENSQFIIVFT
jgi:hypothetical protein